MTRHWTAMPASTNSPARRQRRPLIWSWAVALILCCLMPRNKGLPLHATGSAPSTSDAVLSALDTTASVSDDAEPMLYLITPTYARETQFVDLTRLCQTLLLVPRVHWIVIEDAEDFSPHVTQFMAECGVNYSHLHAATPPLRKGRICQKIDRRIGCTEHRLGLRRLPETRGSAPRNAGLAEVRRLLHENGNEGLVYFADDDNTYSIELFKRMRSIKTIGIWRVGFLGKMRYGGPLSEMTPEGPKLTGWHVGWDPNRPYPLDMASFAFAARLIEDNEVHFPIQAPPGQLETMFLERLLGRNAKLEVMDTDVTRVLVWHTRTERPSLGLEGKLPEAPNTPVI